MTSPYIKRHILQAIEHLRARKARPDLHRICNQLKRRHNCSNNETTRCVDHLLDMGIVIKVEYKGSMSYRDASKWKRGHVAGHIINSNALVVKLQAAVDAIVNRPSEEVGEPCDGRGADTTKSEKGASLEEIESWLKKQAGENACQLTGDALFEVLTREVEMNNLIKSAVDGSYTVGKRVHLPPRQKNCSPSPAKSTPELEEKPLLQIISSMPEETSNSSADDKRQRPPSNRKRIKKYRDEIYELPPIKKSRKQAQVQNMEGLIKQKIAGKKEEVLVEEEFRLAAMFRKCNEVHQTEIPSRHAGQEHEMLVCCGCQMKAHPSCLSYSEDLLSRINREIWRCVTCKKCAKCDLLLRTPSPMTCSGCDLAYHKSCHKPIMRKKPKDDWLCMKCTGSEAKAAAMEEEAPEMYAEETTAPRLCHELAPITEGDWDEAENQAQGDDQKENDVDSVASTEKSVKNTSFPPTPPLSSDVDRVGAEMLSLEMNQQQGEQSVRKVSKFDGEDFPDPISWSVDQVYDYIRNADQDIYAEGAEALKREGIDGEALMFIKREDIISRFGLKVGPAVKLHRLIVNMCTNGNAHMYH